LRSSPFLSRPLCRCRKTVPVDLVVNRSNYVRVPVKLESATYETGALGMDEIPFELDDRARDIQARARAFTEDVLIPLEEEAERSDGILPDDVIEDVKRAATDADLIGGLHLPEHGGQGWSRLEWALVEEQWGRSTNAIHWHVPNAYNVWRHASDEQVQ